MTAFPLSPAGGERFQGPQQRKEVPHASIGLATMLLGVSGSWEDIDATSLPVELEPGPPSEKLTCQTCLKREREKESLQRRKGKGLDPDLVVTGD